MLKLNFQKGLFCLSIILSASCLIFTGCGKPNEVKKVVTEEVKVELKTQKSLAGADLVLVEFNVSDGWHIYGPEPQKNGRPTSVEITQDDKPIPNLNWPKTVSFDEGLSGKSEGFSGNFVISSSLAEMPSKLKSRVSWVACKDICVPGEASLNLNLSR